MTIRIASLVILGACLASTSAFADDEASDLHVGGYVETYGQWNFNAPSNGVTNFRGFDNRHASLTLSNAALDAQWGRGNVLGRLVLQVGHTPSTYYGAEPSFHGTAGANATGPDLWKYLQQAYGGYRLPLAYKPVLTAGLFLSPIGPETVPILENWQWSRSTLFFALPYYHSGVRLAVEPVKHWTVTFSLFNGWNSVVDANRAKSISGQLGYTSERLVFQALYFGGAERERGALEGQPWRHLFDGYVTWAAADGLWLQLHADTGFEDGRFGISSWAAAAAAIRVRVADYLFAAMRADLFREWTAHSALGAASAIFFPVPWVASGTVTLDYQPAEKIAFRAEYRHDEAAGALYFGGDVSSDQPDRRSQDTLTAGLVAGF